MTMLQKRLVAIRSGQEFEGLVCTWRIDTVWGEISVNATNEAITALSLPSYTYNTPTKTKFIGVYRTKPPVMTEETPLITETREQLNAYFEGRLKTFSLPLAPSGTPFQKQVWEIVSAVPYGETITYGEIAQMIDCPKGTRAVGMANRCNPIPVIIPCHRVLGAKGKLTGYSGGLRMKLRLLTLEGHLNYSD